MAEFAFTFGDFSSEKVIKADELRAQHERCSQHNSNEEKFHKMHDGDDKKQQIRKSIEGNKIYSSERKNNREDNESEVEVDSIVVRKTVYVNIEQWVENIIRTIGPTLLLSKTSEKVIPPVTMTSSLCESLVCCGMINTGNTCYRISIFQCLLSCKPLAEIILNESIKDLLEASFASEFVQTWTAFSNFFREFNSPPPSKIFHAINPQDTLGGALGDFRGAVSGAQEDAEEFLAFFLGKLHDEIEQLVVKFGKSVDQQAVRKQAIEDDEWQEIGRGGVTAVVNRQAEARAAAVESIITRIFHGSLRSEVKRGRAPLSVMVEPFHCIQLPVPEFHDSVPNRSGKTAPAIPHLRLENLLTSFFEGEVVEGSKSSQGLAAKVRKQSVIETLPQILTLHLKQYSFNMGLAQVRRTGRKIQYPLELHIPDKCLGANARVDANERGRTYKLFGIVLHLGGAKASASSGHYISLVKRTRNRSEKDTWYYCDDRTVKTISESDVISPAVQQGGAPYLLFYNREIS